MEEMAAAVVVGKQLKKGELRKKLLMDRKKGAYPKLFKRLK